MDLEWISHVHYVVLRTVARVHGWPWHFSSLRVLARAHTASARPVAEWAATLDPARPRTVFIGPEGGFEDGEITALAAIGAEGVSLGPCVMRIEAAAMAATVLLRS